MKLGGLFKKKDKRSGATGDGSGAFLWFNRELIVRGGNVNYGRYIYRNILPFFRSKADNLSQKGVMPIGLYGFFDGKALPKGEVDLPVQNAEQAAVLKEAQFDDFSAVYVVAIHSSERVDFAPLNEKARNLLGYIGMTTCDQVGFQEFDRLAGQLALPYCITLSHDRIQDEGAEFFLGEDELNKMGFLYRPGGSF